MFETHSRAIPKSLQIEFLQVQLSPAIDGSIFVAVTATSVDEPETKQFELVDQEIASGRVATIEAALALVSEQAHLVFHLSDGTAN